MKPTNQQATGTSFHDSEIVTTVKILKKILGNPRYEDNTGRDKVNFDWVMETKFGNVFTVYDYKEYRKLKLNEKIHFHIGGMNADITELAKSEIEEAISKIND